jgi:hypothetical protein
MTATKKHRQHPKPPTRSAWARPTGSARLFLEMLTMLSIFEANIEIGIWPMPGSPCHRQLKRIIKLAEKHRPPNEQVSRP